MTPDQLQRAITAYMQCKLYANPLRLGMPLNSTELTAVKAAARILRGKALCPTRQ